MPAANGITNARSLARFYAALVGGVENGPSEALLTPEQVDFARTCQTEGADRVLSFPGIELSTTIGLGFWTASAFAPFGGERAFGHSGAGGSVGFADPEAGIAGGYVMNKMMQGIAGDPRSRAPDQGQLRRRRRSRRLRVRQPELLVYIAMGSSSTTPESMASTRACAWGTGPALRPSSWPFGMPANT